MVMCVGKVGSTVTTNALLNHRDTVGSAQPPAQINDRLTDAMAV